MSPEKLVSKLKQQNLNIALAESCSAGYASYSLTKTPGASKVFKGSIVVYSLYSKRKFFKIPSSLLEKTQGVSADIAITLAKKVKKEFNSDIGASIVGFAGPSTTLKTNPTTGKSKKVGTVFLGLSIKNKNISKKEIIKGNRDQIRKKASSLLLELIHKTLDTPAYAEASAGKHYAVGGTNKL